MIQYSTADLEVIAVCPYDIITSNKNWSYFLLCNIKRSLNFVMQSLFCVLCIFRSSVLYTFTHVGSLAPDRLYDRDFNTWKEEQAMFLENRQFDKLDLDNLVNEVYHMTKSERQSLESRLEVLLLHLLKYKCLPESESTSWNKTIKEQRAAISDLINNHPFLKSGIEDDLEEICKSILSRKGKIYAKKLHDETRGAVNAKNLYRVYATEGECLWSFYEIVNGTFFPERTGDC